MDIVLSDIAHALGATEAEVTEHLSRAIAADVVAAIIEAHFWPHVQPGEIARVAGVSEPDVILAYKRSRDHYARDQRSLIERRNPDRRDHSAVGEPPTPDHHWCKYADHWVLRDEMGRNSMRANGLGDWCRDCWRDYWRKNVKGKPRAAKRR